MPTYTKKVSKHDRIELDGTDYSNCFRTFGFTSEKEKVPVGGFSVGGNDENLNGATAQAFVGEAFYTEEFAGVVWDWHNDDTVIQVLYQPDGLVNSTAKTYYAFCTVGEFSPSNTFGQASTTPFRADTADSSGITQATGT